MTFYFLYSYHVHRTQDVCPPPSLLTHPRTNQVRALQEARTRVGEGRRGAEGRHLGGSRDHARVCRRYHPQAPRRALQRQGGLLPSSVSGYLGWPSGEHGRFGVEKLTDLYRSRSMLT